VLAGQDLEAERLAVEALERGEVADLERQLDEARCQEPIADAPRATPAQAA
jgi:hypothetical protein